MSKKLRKLDKDATHVFLGDYVDRGPNSVQTVLSLFLRKVLNPDKIFLIRGNHEVANINKKYGFRDEVTPV